MIDAKKSLGQNFLVDKNIIKKIVNLVEIKNNNVIEIGPGKGALTEEILKAKPKFLSLIEKDKQFINDLKNRFDRNKYVQVFGEDILKFNLEGKIKKNTIIFGNLPYNISSQILIKFLRFKAWPPKFSHLILMFQKELGEKIIGKFSTSNYGRLSILAGYRLELQKKFMVSNNCFLPRPKVKSIVLHLKPKKKNSFLIKNIYNLEKITNTLFSNKRKMINKNIKKILALSEIQQIDELNLKFRPSEIKPEIFYKIAELYEKKRKFYL